MQSGLERDRRLLEMKGRLAAFALPCIAFGTALAFGRVAWAAETAPQPPPVDVPAQMTFTNGDAYRGGVLVTPQAPIPNQPQDAKVAFDDGKSRSGYVVPDGPGRLTFNGWTLDATFVHGSPNGPGTLSGPGGFHLADGTFANGSATHGNVTYGDGSTYVGGLQNGCFAGPGKYHSKDGADVSGTWAPVTSEPAATCAGSRLDSGRVNSGATHFDGSLDVAGKPDGKGVFTDRVGRRLSGTWTHGLYAGTFTQRESSGRQDFHVLVAPPSSSLDGTGTFYSLDGSRIYGHFRNGALAGPAVLVDSSGGRHVGEVVDGRFASSDRRYVASLDPYADFKGPRDALGRPDGRGRMPYYDSQHERVILVVSGTWRHGVMTGLMTAKTPGAAAPTFLVKVAPPGNELRGHARVTFPHKSYWQEGTFADGALNGRGSVLFANRPSCRLDGVFHDGVMRRATEICVGDPPYQVEIASDGSVR